MREFGITWKVLRDQAEELIGERDLVYPTAFSYRQFRFDVLCKSVEPEAFLSSRVYCEEHYEELVNLYSLEELSWMTQWLAYMKMCTEGVEFQRFDKYGDRKYGRTKSMTKLDLACYLTIRGDIPEDIGGVCYSLVLFNLPSVIERTNRNLKKFRIREFLKSSPEAKVAMERGEIPVEFGDWQYNPVKCMVESRSEEKIEWAELYQYFRNQFLTPGKVQKLATRLLRSYEARSGVYPESGEVCIRVLSKGERDFYSPILSAVESRLNYWIKQERFEHLEAVSG